MKKIVLTLFLSMLFVLGVNGQEKGDWYVGTGDIAGEKIWRELYSAKASFNCFR